MDDIQKRLWDSAVTREYLSHGFVSVFEDCTDCQDMDKRDRALLALRFVARFSMQDIAKQLNISRKTVSIRLRRILSGLGFECA